LFNLAVPFYYWGFSLFALGSMIIEKKVYKRTTPTPLQIVAQLLLPLSVILSLISINQSSVQAGVTFGLAAIYYGMLAWLSDKHDERSFYTLVAAIAFPVAVSLGLVGLTSRFVSPEVGMGLLATALVYTALSEYFSRGELPRLPLIFAGLASVLILLACGISFQNTGVNLVIVGISVGISLFNLFRVQKEPFYVVYAVALFFLPSAIWRFLQLESAVWLAALYLGLVGAFFAPRKLTLSLTYGLPLLIVSYTAACLTSLYFAMFSMEPAGNIVRLALALVVTTLSLFHLYQLRVRFFYLTFALGLFCLPLAISGLLPQLGGGVFVSALYLSSLAVFYGRRKLILSLPDGLFLLVVSYTISCLASLYFVIMSDEPLRPLMEVVIALVVIGLSYWHWSQTREFVFYIGFVIGLFSLPVAISDLLPQLGDGVFLSAMYLSLVVVFFFTRKRILSYWLGLAVLIMSYTAACLVSTYFAVSSFEPSRAVMEVIIALVVIGLSYWHWSQTREFVFYIGFFIGLFSLPLAISALLPQLGHGVFLSAMYLSLVAVFFFTRKRILSYGQGLAVLVVSYTAACLTSTYFAVLSQESLRAPMEVVISLVVIGLSYWHLSQLRARVFYLGFVIGLFSLPIALAGLATQRGSVAVLSAMYLSLVGVFFITRKLTLSLKQGLPMLIMSYVAACFVSMSIVFLPPIDPAMAIMKVVIALVVIGLSYFHLREMHERVFYLGFVFGLFFLPYAISEALPQLGQGTFLSALYLSVIAVFVVNRRFILSFEQGLQMLILSYATFCLFSLVVAAASAEPTTVIMILANAAVIFALSVYEKIPVITFVPLVLVYGAILRAGQLFIINDFMLSALVSATGVIFYALSYRSPADRKDHFTALGLAGPFMSLMTPIGARQLSPVYAVSGAVGGIMVTLEGIRRHLPIVYKLGVAIVIVAALFFSYEVLKITELQLYTLSWAAYIFWLSRFAKKSEEVIYLLVVLGLVTFPLAFQALEDQTRGFMLIAEGLVMVIVGIQSKRTLVWRWGIVSLVIVVLYYMRDFFLTLPAWVVFGAVGLALLGGSVFLLQRRTQNR
jgi:hypothetical protein